MVQYALDREYQVVGVCREVIRRAVAGCDGRGRLTPSALTAVAS